MRRISVQKRRHDCEILILPWNYDKPLWLHDDILSVSWNRPRQGSGNASVELAMRNEGIEGSQGKRVRGFRYCDFLESDDWVMIYINPGDGLHRECVGWFLIDSVTESWAMAGRGELTRTTVLSCTTWDKVLDRTSAWTSPYMNYKADLPNMSTLANLLAGRADGWWEYVPRALYRLFSIFLSFTKTDMPGADAVILDESIFSEAAMEWKKWVASETEEAKVLDMIDKITAGGVDFSGHEAFFGTGAKPYFIEEVLSSMDESYKVAKDLTGTMVPQFVIPHLKVPVWQSIRFIGEKIQDRVNVMPQTWFQRTNEVVRSMAEDILDPVLNDMICDVREADSMNVVRPFKDSFSGGGFYGKEEDIKRNYQLLDKLSTYAAQASIESDIVGQWIPHIVIRRRPLLPEEVAVYPGVSLSDRQLTGMDLRKGDGDLVNAFWVEPTMMSAMSLPGTFYVLGESAFDTESIKKHGLRYSTEKIKSMDESTGNLEVNVEWVAKIQKRLFKYKIISPKLWAGSLSSPFFVRGARVGDRVILNRETRPTTHGNKYQFMCENVSGRWAVGSCTMSISVDRGALVESDGDLTYLYEGNVE